MNKYLLVYTIFFNLIFYAAFSQDYEIQDKINWKGLQQEYRSSANIGEYLHFTGAFSDIKTSLPLYSASFLISSDQAEFKGEFVSAEYLPFNKAEINYLNDLGVLVEDIDLRFNISTDRKQHSCVVNFIPIRKNNLTGQYEKLISFELSISVKYPANPKVKNTRTYAENSVLASGEWFKISVENTGVYKITHSDFLSYGIDPSSINPENIRIYGNGTGMLPESNNEFRYDDLQEIALQLVGMDDDSFDENDYILFLGMSPHRWERNQNIFEYNLNLYSDNNYYFITTSFGQGKRISNLPSDSAEPTNIVTSYNNYKIAEDENVNIIKSGKSWYGDIFNTTLSRNYEFDFPGLLPDEDMIITIEVANRTFDSDELLIQINNDFQDTINLFAVHPSSTKYAKIANRTFYYKSNDPLLNINLNYQPSGESSTVWLDYILINTRTELRVHDHQLLFRDLISIGEGNISRYIISGTGPGTIIWDISDHINPRSIISNYNTGETNFTLTTDVLHEFVAFDENLLYSPVFIEKVDNQDIHGSGPFDMVIVTHPEFEEQANRLKEIHETHDGFNILIVKNKQVYNEFSSGSQDPTAIRDMMKLLYDKYEGNEPKFLLLFGDGSYDLKDRILHNTNYIPTFYTKESLLTASSYVIDDYYGCLDDNEGNDGIGTLDIGIGRLPVQTTQEANDIIKKIEQYIAKGSNYFGPWRSRICFIADDEDGNLHMDQADSIASGLGYIPETYNQKKIYLDAYPQIITSKGETYPAVTEEIYNQIEEGALIMNYIGHGGKLGWAHERILLSSDIMSWENFDKLPVFITATCEFSRFDEPELATAGEIVLLNPSGGGVALFTTTRLAYSASNFSLNRRFYENAFTRIDGELPYMGDLIRLSKPPGQLSTRNFVLLGDPALRMAYPELNVKTTEINGLDIEAGANDSISALDMVTIKGHITNNSGNKVDNFNGTVYPVIYDKKTQYFTFGHDESSYPEDFYCQDKILWEGKASVKNGEFIFSFIMPQDIAYNFGAGKISYYAISDHSDAAGFYNEVIIGGTNEFAEPDNQGPEIKLYLNDENFISGDQTHENPLMIAHISDLHGINTSDNGIGHEIVAVLDDDYSTSISLNDYYEPDLDSYQGGKINYPFFDLDDGFHTLTLKAWDSYNNSSSKTIEFYINNDATLLISEVMNKPNPFKQETTFYFKHTRPNDELDIQLTIFDINGKIVFSHKNAIVSESTMIPFYQWDGRSTEGNKLNSGVYIYTLKVIDEDGNISSQRQKLLFLN